MNIRISKIWSLLYLTIWVLIPHWLKRIIGLCIAFGDCSNKDLHWNWKISTISLYQYGGANNSVYLGCITCNKVQTDSICNSFGTYGSAFNSSSIWNQFGTYGSSFQTYSPWNSYSSNGPLIVGSNNLSYGYFKTNSFKSNRTTGQAFLNILNYYSSTNNLASTSTYACGY